MSKDFIICGLGLSLNRWIDLLPQYNTIGVNDISRYFTPDTVFVMDRPSCFIKSGRLDFIQDAYADIWTYNAHQWEFKNPKSINTFETCHFLSEVKDGEDYIDKCASKVFPKLKMSPFCAIGLAVYLGAERIGLLGVDLDTKTHHMGKHLKEMDGALDMLQHYLAGFDIKLLNLGGGMSKIQSLPFVDLGFFRKK